jgi:hypothetical protein
MDARRTQLGFSATIWKIEPRICLEILRPPPTRFRTPQSMAQYSLNPARCQRTTVSGWTRKSASFHCDQTWRTTTQNSLSNGASLGLGCLRFKTASCCRRVRFSRIKLRRSAIEGLLRGNEIHPGSSPQRDGRRNGASVKPSGPDETWFRMAQPRLVEKRF